METPAKTRRTRRTSAATQPAPQGDLLGDAGDSPAGALGRASTLLGAKRGPLDNFFEEIKRGSEQKAYVRIKRIVDHERAYLVQGGKVLWTEYPGPEFIEKNWGGGNYLVEYYSGGTEPRDRLPRATEKIDIEGPAREPAPPAAPISPYAQPPQPGYAPEQIAGQITQAITKSMEPLMQTMARALERLSMPPSAPANPGPSLLDLTQALKNMQSLIPTPPPAPAAPEPVNQLGQLKEMMQLAKEFTNPEAAESNPLAFLEKAIDKLGGPLIEHLQNERTASQQIAATTTQTQVRTVSAMPKNQLQQDLDQLMIFCDRGEPPINLVSVAINMIPEHLLPQLLQLPDPVAALARFEPRAAQEPYTSWLRELVDGIKEELAEESQDNSGAATS